jgi:hypothetical protein
MWDSRPAVISIVKEGKEEGSSKMSATGSAPVDDQKVEVSGQGSEKEVIWVPEKAQSAT